MVSGAAIQKMKQTNISLDAEKTKQRVRDLWKNATNEERTVIENLAGVKRTTVMRVYKTGSISAKLAVPIAQTLNTNPFYLTGESDDRGEYSDHSLQEFLKKYKYEALVKMYAATEKRAAKKVKAEDLPEELLEARPEQNDGAQTRETEPEVQEMIPSDVLDTLSDDEVFHLVRSLLIKSKAGGKHAEILKRLKLLLFL